VTESSGVIGALDIGTNSFHLVIARATHSGFEVIAREKEMVRLGEGSGDMKLLSPEAIERGVIALRNMRRIADVHGAELRAIATSAVREARNADIFINRALKEASIVVEVISGVEEARLIHLGVMQAIPLMDTRSIVIDIGGGSTEVVVADGLAQHFVRSFKLGAIRLTTRFFSSNSLHPSATSACRKFLHSTLSPSRKEIIHLAPKIAVVSSGTAEALASMVRILRDGTEPKSMNGFKFTIEELEVVVDLLAQSPTVEMRRQLRGVDASRADIILAGALILDAVAHEFELQNFIFSDFALREGIILDTLQRTERLDHQHLHQVSLNSVMRLVERCDDDVAHSKNVARLALELYDSLEQEYDFSPEWRVLLEAASLLANVGLIVSHSKHHLHSYYVIRNSDLVGFTDHEIELIALIARYHRKGPPKPTHNEFAKLSETEQQLIIFLAGILRVAIGLDRSHDGRVARLDVEIKKSSVDITVNTSMTQIDALDMNLYAARERQQLLETALGVPIMFVAVSDD